MRTSGNPNCHIVLRGGAAGPNFGAAPVAAAAALLAKAGLHPSILVDCSHDNSAKQPERQPEILREVLAHAALAGSPVMGVMIESNLSAGSQPFPRPRNELQYGVSITDGCIDWATTEATLRAAYQTLGPAHAAKQAPVS